MLKFKFIYPVLFGICTTFINAQDDFKPYLEVNYKINFNTEIPTQKDGKLYVGNKKSIFVYGKKSRNEVKNKKDNSVNIVLGSITKFNYIDFVKDSIFSLDKLNEEFIVKEKKPSLQWQLYDEEKVVDSIKLRKAKLNFRGRNYVAWYTLDYPVANGPWKFHGLPGLIIEIYDESMRYHWVATSIIKNDISEIPTDFKKQLINTKIITIKEYVEKRYNSRPLFDASRLPRNVEISTKEIPRNGFEIKFEWEVENKDN